MVSMEQIKEVGNSIAAHFNPKRVILFGSYAYGTPRAGSDVDILVIMPFSGRSFDMAIKIWKTIRPTIPVEIVVRRPEDSERRYRENDPLIHNAFDKGIVLYDRDHTRVA